MREMRDILAAFERAEEPSVVASIVRTEGSTFRKAGARMLIFPSGATAGMISGGCLEHDIVDRARTVLLEGAAQLVCYATTDEADIVFGWGVGCRGRVELLIEPISRDAPGPLPAMASAISGRQPVQMATVIRTRHSCPHSVGARWMSLNSQVIPNTHGFDPASYDIDVDRVLRSTACTVIERDDLDCCVERIDPPVRLMVFGHGPDTIPLARIADELGWTTEVHGVQRSPDPAPYPDSTLITTTPPSALPNLEFDEFTAAVVMTHNYLHDTQLVSQLSGSRGFYVGVLGPHARTQQLIEDARRQSPLSSGLDRIRGPVGLDIGSTSPEQIALSIVAEIEAVRTSRSGRALCEIARAATERAG